MDTKTSSEDIEHFKFVSLKSKIRADGDQTSVFRNEEWQKTNAIIQYKTGTPKDVGFVHLSLFSFEITLDHRLSSLKCNYTFGAALKLYNC